MIKMANVYKQYSEDMSVLINVSFEIKQGEFLYFVGPSGAGKTTLIKLMTCEERLTEGFFKMGNVDLKNLPDQQIPIFRRQLGVVPQDIFLLDHLTVYKNLVNTLHAIEVDRREIKNKVMRALEQVGMVNFKNAYPRELSIGQQQKIAIARAIVNQPKIILADEPTGNLDNKSAIEIMKIFYQLNQQGTTIIMATHNSTLVNTVRYRVLEIKKGRITRDQEQGTYGLASDKKDVFVI